MWPDRRYLDLVGIEHPIVQAPMAGATSAAMAVAVSEAGGLGSLPCGMLSLDQARSELNIIRQQTDRPVNVNFFCHAPPTPDEARERAWRARLAPYYAELGLDPKAIGADAERAPFDAVRCDLMVEMKPRVVSFHFGLPEARLIDGLHHPELGHHRGGGGVARSPWRRCRHRPGNRGRRAPRHVPHR